MNKKREEKSLNRESANSLTGSIRLQKFIAEQGICSRRKAEALIEEGKVTLNGETAVLGNRVDPSSDMVRLNGRPLVDKKQKKVVLVLNKPRGYACTNEDPHADLIVMDLLPKSFAGKRLFCAGRLDKDSEGLLIMTNDGALANRVTHPSSEIRKTYSLKLSRPLESKHLPLLEKGKELEGEFLRIDKVLRRKSNQDHNKKVEVVMGHGKKREIRRIFSAFGYKVERLRRTRIGRFSPRKLALGQVKELTPEEIDLLFERETVTKKT